MHPRHWLILALTLAAACTCGREADDQGGSRAPPGTARVVTATVAYVEGNVRIKQAGSMEWRPATAGQQLTTDDKLRTLRDSFATIEFVAGENLRVGPESLVSVTDLRIEPRNQARRVTFTLVEGAVEAEVDALAKPGSEFKVRTPTAETSVLRREVAFQ